MYRHVKTGCKHIPPSEPLQFQSGYYLNKPRIVLRGRWCNIVLNVHAPSEEKSDDSKGRFYEKLEQVFSHFPKYGMKILLDFNAKLG